MTSMTKGKTQNRKDAELFINTCDDVFLELHGENESLKKATNEVERGLNDKQPVMAAYISKEDNDISVYQNADQFQDQKPHEQVQMNENTIVNIYTD